MERGREQPPDSSACPLPRPARRVAHAPNVRAGMLAGSRCDLRAECTRVVTCELARDPVRNSLYFSPYFSAFTLLSEVGHHNGQDRAVLDVVKALAALDPAGSGLDDACAQLESSTYVMANEARPHFGVDRGRQQSYREVLVDAIRHPFAVSPDAER